jgi:hypothetical protein
MKNSARTTVENYIRINNGVKTRQQMSDDLGISYTKLAGIVIALRKAGLIQDLPKGFRGHTFNKPSKLETL